MVFRVGWMGRTGRRAVASLSIVTLVMSGCARDVGRVGVYLSPDGSLIADWYQLSGGGPAGSSEDRVQLRRRGERFRVQKDFVFGGGSANVLRILWKSNAQLDVTYPTMTGVRRSESQWNDVSITYHEDPRLRERGY